VTRSQRNEVWRPTVTPEDVAAVAAIGAVDEAWYIEKYPDVAGGELPPLLHYLLQGWSEGRDPGPGFSTSFYLKANPDVAEAGRNPLVHYATQGWREGRAPREGFRASTPEGLEEFPPLTIELAGVQTRASHQIPHEPDAWLAAAPSELSVANSGLSSDVLTPLASRAKRPAAAPPPATGVRTVAFYLPQFHPIAENDAWWGDGFTEWTNVVKGLPQFPGHHQPHVPDELGYYDLRDADVMPRQIELARLHGVSAFCFYAYWFGGKRLLEGPLDAFLADSTLEIDFCVCWANEDWTRTWNGAGDEILIGQQHSPDDDLAFIEEMSRYLRDPRYLHVEGRPLLLVYRPSLLPDAKETTRRWRRWCRENGIGEIWIAYVQGFDKDHPSVFGCDSAVEFPPNNTGPVHLEHLEEAEGFEGQVYDWTELAHRSRTYSPAGPELWRGVTPSWDNTARRGSRSAVLWGANPTDFREWLVNAGTDTIGRLPENQRLVFVNAWNEWAEGAHLEPDKEYGYQWLHAVRDAQCVLAGAPLNERGPGVVLVTHDLHEHGAQMLALAITRMLRRLGVAVEAVSLREGELRGAFEGVAPLHVLESDDGEAAASLAADLVRRGFTTAICNTSVAGHFAMALRRAGADVTGLVHELPSVLEDPERGERGRALASAAHRIWFPAAKVAADYPFALDVDCETVVRPQGVYRVMPGMRSAGARERLRGLLGIGADATVVLGVGYGDHRKGLDLFAEMAEAAPQSAEGSPLHFVWVGRHDAFDPRVVDAVTAAGPERLHMVGFVQDPAEYFQGADVFALPSREDPFPSVVLEAIAVGLPVVAFRDRTGQDDLVQRTGGLLVEDLSASMFVEGLLDALRKDAPDAQDLATARRDHIRSEFNFRRYVMDLLALTPSALPRVSAVVPSYNYARLIGHRIEQVLAQTYPLYELIVLDDASTDDSVEVILAAVRGSDLNVRVQVNEVNSGSVFVQWRRGAELATGDMVWIAEADDVADPDFLSTLVPELLRDGVALAFCQSKQLGPEGEVLANDYLDYVADIRSRDWTRRYRVAGIDEVLECLAVRNTIPNVSAVLFDGDVFRDVMASADLERLPTSGDWSVYVDVLRHGEVVFHPASLNGHRRHADSVVATGLGRRHLVEILTMQAQICAEFGVDTAVRRIALDYVERLFEQFELGSPEDLRHDPELLALIERIEPRG
jgi:glycosyltransferase involved in cell wall biosynthesis